MSSDMEKLRLNCVETLWSGEPGVCQICANPLKGKRRVFCSDKCRRWFASNHVWRFARRLSRQRAKYVCSVVDCTTGREGKLEVNHIVPRDGGGYGVGCWHHQSNLELLCHDHHVAVTAKQRFFKKQKKAFFEDTND